MIACVLCHPIVTLTYPPASLTHFVSGNIRGHHYDQMTKGRPPCIMRSMVGRWQKSITWPVGSNHGTHAEDVAVGLRTSPALPQNHMTTNSLPHPVCDKVENVGARASRTMRLYCFPKPTKHPTRLEILSYELSQSHSNNLLPHCDDAI